MCKWRKLVEGASTFVAVVALSGCSVLTAQDNAVHFQVGQKVRFIGPINDGDYYIVLPEADSKAPNHAWKIEPFVATRVPDSEDEYTLHPIVLGQPPGQDEHSVGMKIVHGKPGLKIEMTGEDHEDDVDHNGTVHFD